MRLLQHLRTPGGYWLWLILIYALVAVAAQFLPMTSDLHYELALLVALCASIFSGFAFLFAPGSSSAATRPAYSLWERTWISVLLSFTPLIVALLLSIFNPQCGLLDGVAWYLVLVPASAWISAIIALLAQTLTHRRWLQVVLFLLLWLASMGRGAFEAYTGPHMFLYAWQIGYFPGSSWDAELPITAQLLIYRVGHLLIAGALALLLDMLRRARDDRPVLRRRPGVIAFAALCALLGTALLPYRPELGLTRTDSWLRAELGDSLRTRFTTIYYNGSSVDSLGIWRAANYADFYVAKHARKLGIPLDRVEPITFYLYSSPGEEKRLVGTSSASFTKPWRRTLNMAVGNLEGALSHELVHVLLEPYGGVLGVSVSQGLLEGSAVALEEDVGWRTMHEYARALYHFEMAPPPEELMSASGFSSRRTSLSYLIAGSFSKWLIDVYGIERYLRAYHWGDFEEAYGVSLSVLSRSYRRYIDRVFLPPSFRPTMQYLYGGGSFFSQKCLRRIGTLNGLGFEALAAERYERALDRFRHSIEEGITYTARAGIFSALRGLGRYREMLDSAAVYARDTASYPLLPYLIEQGDAWWALGDTARAARLYDSVRTLDISRALTARALLRLYFMRGPDSLARHMRGYFVRPMTPVQLLGVLDEGHRFTTTETQRLIITLMRAARTVGELPLSSVELLERYPAHIDTILDAGPGTYTQLERAVLPSLAFNLLDAAIYGSTLDARNGRAISPVCAAIIDLAFADLHPYSWTHGTADAGAIEVRREESRAFRAYLVEHTIFP